MGILATTVVLVTIIIVVAQNLKDRYDERKFSNEIEDYLRKELDGPDGSS